MKNYPCFYLTCSFLLLCLSALGQVQVNQFQPLLPVLTLKEANPVLRLELIKSGEDARLIKDIVCSLKGTTRLDDIESVCLYAAAKNGSFSAKTLLTAPQPATSKVTFKYPLSLQADTTIVWLSVKLKDKIDLAHRIQLSCTAVKTDLGKVTPITVRPLVALRTGVAVRQYQQDGVHTSRIPGIATSQKGTLLAVYDARYDTSRDLQGDIDIALNRSFDGGATWQPMQVVLDRKEWGGLPEKYNGVSDACVLVDRQTGAIYVAGLWMHGVLDG
ncbi:MAG: sialidase family protein, partial [Bacteroides sp.]